MRIVVTVLFAFFLYVFLGLGCYFLLRLIIDYASFNTDINFLKLKQEWVPEQWWRIAFYVHVFTAILALMSGFTQFSNFILQKFTRLHRIVGWIYVVDILLINFPSGMILALTANGTFTSRLAFVLLDCLWFWFTLKAVVAIRNGRIHEHKDFMIRSYALTLSAITLRMWKPVLAAAFHPDPEVLYMIQAWIGFVPNLLLAEWMIRRRRRLSFKRNIVDDKNKPSNKDHS